MKRTPWLSELEAQESLWGLLSVERLLDLEKKLDRADRRMILEMVAAALIGALCSAALMWESARMLIQALAPRSSAGWWALALTAIWLWMSVTSNPGVRSGKMEARMVDMSGMRNPVAFFFEDEILASHGISAFDRSMENEPELKSKLEARRAEQEAQRAPSAQGPASKGG